MYHCSGMKHACMRNFFLTYIYPINTNLIHFIPVLNFLSHSACYGVQIGPSRTFAVYNLARSHRTFVVLHFRTFAVSQRPFVARITLSFFRSLALPLIRCFALPFYSFASPFRGFAWPFCCFAFSLFRSLVILRRPFVVSHCPSVVS